MYALSGDLLSTRDERAPVEVGAHQSRSSISRAAFSSAGQVATASHDDTVKVYGRLWFVDVSGR